MADARGRTSEGPAWRKDYLLLVDSFIDAVAELLYVLLDTVDSTLLTIALYIGDSRKPVPKSDIFGYLCMSKEGDAGYCCSPRYGRHQRL